ncbi:hypothetical protein AB7168_22295, partial [Escherichia coli]
MKLILPFPPSVNTYWRHPNKGAFAGKSLISEAGRKFQSAACAAIVEQLRRLPKPTSAPASVEIVLFPPDNGAHFDGDQSGTVNGVTPPAVQHLTAEVSADSGEYQVLARWDTPKVVKGVSFLL